MGCVQLHLVINEPATPYIAAVVVAQRKIPHALRNAYDACAMHMMPVCCCRLGVPPNGVGRPRLGCVACPEHTLPCSAAVRC